MDGHCMDITTRSDNVVYNKHPTSTKDKQGEDQVDTEENENKPIDELEEVQKRVAPARGQEKKSDDKLLL